MKKQNNIFSIKGLLNEVSTIKRMSWKEMWLYSVDLCRQAVRATRRFVRTFINNVLKAAIILIALIMAHGWIEAHPAEWTNIVSNFMNVINTVMDAIRNVWPF